MFYLSKTRMIRVGRFGTFEFPKGTYYYVGSAQRNREKRLNRHARRRKVLRWHVDYLSSKGRMLGAILIDGDREKECALAREMAHLFPRAVAGFGASDCRCGGHLFYSDGDA